MDADRRYTVRELTRLAQSEPSVLDREVVLVEDARSESERLREALRDAIQTWSFTDGQQHTHSWHDREDWFARHPVALDLRRALAKEEDR